METQAEYKVKNLAEAATTAYQQELIRQENMRNKVETDDLAKKSLRLEKGVMDILRGSYTPVEWSADFYGLTVDGIRFTAELDRWGEDEIIAIWGLCPKCGKAAHSIEIYTFAGLGEQIANFTPASYAHKCDLSEPERELPAEPTWEENMLELVNKGIEGRDSGEIYARPADYFLQVIAESMIRIASNGGAK
jgi:hypothetical protein